MNPQKLKLYKRLRRKIRVRKKVSGTPSRPRLSVFRSLKHLNCQLIDDVAGRTLLSMGTQSPDYRAASGKPNGGNRAAAELVGTLLAKKAVEMGVKAAVLDRSGYRFHGRIKALVESMRKNGVNF